MKKLIVMYSVNRKDPEGTWSGTSYSLMTALQKFYDVTLIDLHEGIFLKTLNKLKIRMRGKAQTIVGTVYDRVTELKAAWLLRKYKNIPVLEIANEVRIRPPYYLYQDLSLVTMSKEKEKLKAIGVKGGGVRAEWSDSELNRKIALQKEIYEGVEAAFFMGNWVTKSMKTIYPELKDRFYFAGGGLNSRFSVPNNLSVEDKEKTVTFIGIDFERKGGDIVLKAFLRMKEKYQCEGELYIAGPENVCAEKNDSVHLLGRVERSQLSDILKKSTVFCMPSRFEAYGLVFPEAMCYGNLCIGRNCYEMPYFISKREGLLIESDDIEKLADTMYLLLNDRKMLEKAISSVQEKREYYSWEAVAERIAAVIDKN